MRELRDLLAPRTAALFGVAVVFGASVAMIVGGGEMTLPVVGTTPVVAVGAVGLLASLGAYVGVDRYST